MHVIPITCIVRAIQPQIISTLMMLMMLMVGITMHCNEDVDDDGGGSVNGGQTQITHNIVFAVCPPSHPKPFDNHIISNHDDETLIRTFIPSVQCNTL